MFNQILKKLTDPESRANTLRRMTIKYINPWLRKLGLTLVVHHFYQPIPDDEEIALYHNKIRPVEMIDWKIAQQIDFTDSLLSAYSQEYNNIDLLKSFGYNEAGGTFGSGSREFYFSMIRKFKPRKIIEIGAGNSSMICLAALKKNYDETGIKANFTSIEPFPWENIRKIAHGTHEFVHFELIINKLQAINPSIFQSLEANDILFVDSSHIFKQGSDVEYEFLKIYPYLKAGVFVHIHDIFAPFDYPAIWNNKYFCFWNEQYHLETFLLCNSRFDVVSGLCMLNHERAEIFEKHIKGYNKDQYSSSFWIQAK